MLEDWITTQNSLLKLTVEVSVHKLHFAVVEDMILLIETLGGKPTPATGFAAGMERILLACENEKSFYLPEPAIDIYLDKN